MICVTCNTSIPPAWKACIQTNICPGCNGPIMDDAAKELLVQLKEAMEKMPNDPEGLAGWILSTFDLRPKGAIEPTVFYGKRSQQSLPDQELKWANDPSVINKFMERAGVNKIAKNSNVASMIQAINEFNNSEDIQYEKEEEITPEEEELIEIQEQKRIAKIANKAKAQGKKLSIKDLMINEETNISDEGIEPSEEDVQAFEANISPGNIGNLEEIIDPKIQMSRLKRLAAQKELAMGGSTGIIKRN